MVARIPARQPPYAYREESGRVVLSWRGRDLNVLKGLQAQRFLDRSRLATAAEMQRLIAELARLA